MLSISSCAFWTFVYLLWRNVYSSPLPIFNWVFFLLLSCKSFSYILVTEPLLCMKITNIFSHSVVVFCSVVSFDVQKFLILKKSNLFIFSCCFCFYYHIEESAAKFKTIKIHPYISSKSSISLTLIFRSLIYFELIKKKYLFVYLAALGLSCDLRVFGVFPDPGLNLHLLHCEADSPPLGHQGSP